MTGGRHPLWERRLNEYLASVAMRPHSYGEHDCLIHPGMAIEAVTGIDLVSEHRGKYRSHASAVRYLSRLGFSSPAAILDSIFHQIPVGLAQRADLVLVPGNDGAWDLPAVAVGSVARGVGTDGLFTAERTSWLKAWKVGE